jgi:L-lactate dehydrogenase (cytochrome)
VGIRLITSEPIHAPGILEETLPPEKHLGPVDPATVEKAEPEKDQGLEDIQGIPPIQQVLNLDDFEVRISSDSCDSRKSVREIQALVLGPTIPPPPTMNYVHLPLLLVGLQLIVTAHVENTKAFRKVLFRPRVFVDISECDQSCTLLGLPSTSPIFIAPAALAKLGHPGGEINLTKGAGISGIIQAMSTNASNSVEELSQARISPNQKLWFQLYVNKDRKATQRLLKRVVDSGAFAGLFITVDAPVLGKREKDERLKASVMPVLSATSGAGGQMSGGGAKSVTKALATFVAHDLVWEEIAWMKKLTGFPVVVKGIMTAEDAILAMKYGCEGIYLSNHGGRQLDTSPPAILTLLELRKHCPQVFEKMQVFLDGGIRRGTDVVKALCLGVKAVGLGRPFLYANACYGEEGVLKAIESISPVCCIL